MFKIVDGGLVSLVDERLYVDYSQDGGTTGSEPVGVVATDQGIFVASHTLGAYSPFFRKKAGMSSYRSCRAKRYVYPLAIARNPRHQIDLDLRALGEGRYLDG